jgi:hypothetical protein
MRLISDLSLKCFVLHPLLEELSSFNSRIKTVAFNVIAMKWEPAIIVPLAEIGMSNRKNTINVRD